MTNRDINFYHFYINFNIANVIEGVTLGNQFQFNGFSTLQWKDTNDDEILCKKPMCF